MKRVANIFELEKVPQEKEAPQTAGKE